jgi:hypothetical protein
LSERFSSRINKSPGAKRRMFIFTETAKLGNKRKDDDAFPSDSVRTLPVKDASGDPLLMQEAEQRCMENGNSDRVIEKSEDENRMHPV